MLIHYNFTYIQEEYLNKIRLTDANTNVQVTYIEQQQVTAEQPPTYNEVI